VLFRRPNVAEVDRVVHAIRAPGTGSLIPAGPDAPFKLANALRRGQHVGMMVDQHLHRGVDVTFFGRPAKANPLIARLARLHKCAIHGVQIIRLPGNRFRIELTEALKTPCEPSGRMDIAGTMQVITAVVEGWVRQHPEQWLWLHRRWR
jgi:KDO2-lipid IV(A) lauroyltransferase